MQMFHPQGIFKPHAAEMLRCEMRNAGEFERFFLRESIADLNRAVIMNADDIARICLFDIRAVLRHKNCGIGERHFLADTVMNNAHAALKLSRADPHKSNTVAVRRIHVGLDFKNKAGKIIFIGVNISCRCRAGERRRSDFHESVEKFLNAEIVNSAAEEYRRLARF